MVNVEGGRIVNSPDGRQKETVYVETTVIGHLAGRLHPDPLISPRQHFARRWWPELLSKYRVVVSHLVIDECSAGDADAALERLEILRNLELLEIYEEVQRLADSLVDGGAIPKSQPRDALHVAIAAFYGVEYLVSWNFRHIVNAALRSRIEAICRDAGFEPPVICTPEELAAEEDNEISD